jgi:tetratricopeptide (TPR) repeat protein
LDYTGTAGQTSRQVSSPYGTLSLRTNQRLLDDSATLRAALPAGQFGRQGMIDPVSNLAARVEARAGAEAMFGLLRSEDRSSLVRELYDVGYARQDGRGRRDRQEADADREALATERPLPPETPERQWPQPDPDESAEDQADPSAPSPEADALAPGQDTLLDMLAVLRGRSGDANAPVPPAGSLPDVEEVLSGQPGTPTANVTVENGEVVVRSLAGRSKDPANSYMRSAERELGSGQFYRASKSFESASLADPRNPLPHVGKGLALLGAGEKVAAASELKEALRGFPQLMDVRVDLGRLLPDQAARRVLQELDSLVADVDDEKVDGDMLFLATWVQANLGQPARALTYASRLKGIGRRRDIELYRVYARNVEEMYGRPAEAGP